MEFSKAIDCFKEIIKAASKQNISEGVKLKNFPHKADCEKKEVTLIYHDFGQGGLAGSVSFGPGADKVEAICGDCEIVIVL